MDKSNSFFHQDEAIFREEYGQMKLHITNLSPRVTEAELKNLIGKYGTVLGIEITWSRQAGRVSGIAIVDMHVVEALAAARQLNGKAFRSRRLYITLMGEVVEQARQPSQIRV